MIPKYFVIFVSNFLMDNIFVVALIISNPVLHVDAIRQERCHMMLLRVVGL